MFKQLILVQDLKIAIRFFGVLKKKTVNKFSLNIYVYLFGILNVVR